VIVVSALAVPAGVLGSAAAASATVQPVAGTARLNGVACPTTTCVAVGLNPDGQGGEQGVVVPVTNGVPGSAVVVPGTARLTAVACSSTTTCEAVGLTSSNPSASQGVVVPVTNGAPGTAQPVAGTTGLDGVACPAAGTCVAVGDNSSYQGVVVPVTNGAPGSAQAVPGTTTLDGVACPTATTCEATGEHSLPCGCTSEGVVVPVTNGVPGSAVVAPGTLGLVGVACPTATTCEAIGGLGLVPITNGTPGPAQPGPVGAALVGVACPTASTCEAVGTNNSTGQGAVVPVVNGTPGAVQTVAGSSYLFGVACPTASRCETAGLIYTSAGAGSDGVVAAVAIQTVVSLSFDNGAVSQYTLGYQHALQPQGVKATFYINTGVMGGANHLSWSQLSALHSAGQEIGGKTVDGTSLTTLSASQQTAEICNDRQALLSHGLSPAGFAYPAGAFNTTIESEVQGCGYNNARTAGSLSPAGPGYAETLPPKNWLALRAYAPTGQVTLANLEALVTGAASHGNGWIPIVIQKICSQTADPNNYATCTSSSGWIDLADLNTFLTWVNNAGQPGGAPAGTVFSPVGATATSLGQPPS
jgi:peptidoglycan/xylan/chitin deacetylase (PgdA/CDA1 family)